MNENKTHCKKCHETYIAVTNLLGEVECTSCIRKEAVEIRKREERRIKEERKEDARIAAERQAGRAS